MTQHFWHLLARTWSAVASFHPQTQEQGKLWEDALVAVLPEAERVANQIPLSSEQQHILDTLLASLQDNATHLITMSGEQPGSSLRPSIISDTHANNVVSVHVKNWFNFRIAPGYFDEWEEAMHSLNQAIENASTQNASVLILDFTNTKGDSSDENAESVYIHGRMRRELASHLFTEPVMLPSLARVQQVGYRDPVESGEALGGYVTEWVSQANTTRIMPSAHAFSGRLIVLTAPDTSALLEPVLILLQQTGRALCIGTQSYAYHAYDQNILLTDDISLQLRRYSLMYHDRPARYAPHIITDDPLATAFTYVKTQQHVPEQQSALSASPTSDAYTEMLPSRPQRIMAAIKLWSALHTYYAYRDHLHQWDDALIPGIEAAANATTREAYFAALQRLSSRCKGGHNFVLFTRETQLRFANRPHGYAPALRLARNHNGEIVAIGSLSLSNPLHTGDVLLTINGEAIQAREQRLRPLFEHYPDGAIDHYLLQALLDSPKESTVSIKVRTIEGDLRMVTLVADHPVAFVTEPIAVTMLPAWGMLAGKFASLGYLDASRVDITQIDTALQELGSAKALIIDIRRYPTLPIQSLQRFQRAPIPVQTMLRPVITEPEKGIFGWLENRFYDEDVILPPKTPDMRPIAALIGAGTISMGEDWAYQLLTGYGATLVGSVTAGGVGSNAFVLLPGSGRASFSGAVLPKGALEREIEGNGIDPHITVDYSYQDEHDIAVIMAARSLLMNVE